MPNLVYRLQSHDLWLFGRAYHPLAESYSTSLVRYNITSPGRGSMGPRRNNGTTVQSPVTNVLYDRAYCVLRSEVHTAGKETCVSALAHRVAQHVDPRLDCIIITGSIFWSAVTQVMRFPLSVQRRSTPESGRNWVMNAHTAGIHSSCACDPPPRIGTQTEQLLGKIDRVLS